MSSPSIQCFSPATELPDVAFSHALGTELNRAKQAFLKACARPEGLVHVVLGNESADLDSVCSAVVLALHRMRSGEGLWVPIISVSAQELELRKDVQHVLGRVGVEVDDVLDRASIADLQALMAQGRLRVHLVDHNEVAREFEFLVPAVEDFLDHHVDAGVEFPQLRPERCRLERCASSASLVAQLVLDSSAEPLPPEFAQLLLAPLLLDSRNMAPQGPATDLDRRLLPQLVSAAQVADTDVLYHDLRRWRADVAGLTAQQMLIRDVKEYQQEGVRYAISSFPPGYRVSEGSAARHLEALSSICTQRGWSLHFSLLEGGPCAQDARTILIFSVELERAAQVADRLMQHQELGIHLSRGPLQGPMVTLYSDCLLPRKEFQPLLREMDLL